MQFRLVHVDHTQVTTEFRCKSTLSHYLLVLLLFFKCELH